MLLKFPKSYYDVKSALRTCRICVNRGGSSSGKTYSTLQVLIEHALLTQNYGHQIITIVREALPSLKRSAMRDFLNILNSHKIPYKWNKTESTFLVGNSTFEFVGLDDPQKARGPRRNILFINECNEISLEAYRQLALRTSLPPGKIILDFNPSGEFWICDELLNGRPDVVENITTYQDNPFLSPNTIDEIERYKEINPNFWRVFGLGEWGIAEGLVYPLYRNIAQFPDDLEYYGYGLDFGYANDETALIKCGIRENNLFLHQEIYQTKLTTNDLINLLNQLEIPKNKPIIADSARPDSIEEIRRAGFFIRGVKKAKLSNNKDSLEGGIALVQNFKLNVTESSHGLIHEFKNYKNHFDNKLNKYTNTPIDAHNHAMDALRYFVLNYHRDQPVDLEIKEIDYNQVIGFGG